MVVPVLVVMLVVVPVLVVVPMLVVVVMLVPVAVVVVVVVCVLSGPRDVEASPHERPSLAPPERDAQAAYAHRLHGIRHDGSRHAQVDQRRDGHVASDAGGGLEMQVQAAQRLHRSRFRLSIAAI
jgi:hypothetical protein